MRRLLSSHFFVRTGTPRLSTRLVTRLLAHSIWLSLVLCHAGVDGPVIWSELLTIANLDLSILHDIRADWRPEDRWQRVSVLARLAIGTMDGDGRTARHFAGCCVVMSEYCSA